MIYEIAVLPVHSAQIEQFKQAFAEVVHLLQRAKGYHGHMFARGIESPETFNLIVRWASLEDHSPGFEASDDHQTFMLGLEKYFSQEPTVYHIQEAAFTNGNDQAFDIAVPKA
ncbi:antibiotic biosynthesis monooxygenase family protein [Ectopseudomonas chengduensis]|nr:MULTISPECIES: antibiotic biosynthesis monooxygenase [unclassified Pseudomonas]NMY14685.1 antibiotic biosynthesis monooxygenase [Pseudomonas sp. WS 5019]